MVGPEYYQRGSIQVWDFIRDQDLNFHLGNSIKYICRAGHKGGNSKAEDLKKAIHYLENELQNTTRPSNRVSAGLQPEWWDETTGGSEIFDR